MFDIISAIICYVSVMLQSPQMDITSKQIHQQTVIKFCRIRFELGWYQLHAFVMLPVPSVTETNVRRENI